MKFLNKKMMFIVALALGCIQQTYGAATVAQQAEQPTWVNPCDKKALDEIEKVANTLNYPTTSEFHRHWILINICFKHNSLNVLHWLVTHNKVNLNPQEARQSTYLMHLARSLHVSPQIVYYLIRQPAILETLYYTTQTGFTARELAQQHNNQVMIKLLTTLETTSNGVINTFVKYHNQQRALSNDDWLAQARTKVQADYDTQQQTLTTTSLSAPMQTATAVRAGNIPSAMQH